MSRRGRLLNRARLQRLALGLFVLWVFVTAASAIAISDTEVVFATQVWGPARWTPGESVGLRVATFDPNNHRYYSGFETKISLEGRAGAWRRVLVDARTDGTALSFSPQVPRSLPAGGATLVVSTRRGEEEDRSEIPVQVGPPLIPEAAVEPEVKAQQDQASEAKVRVDLVPLGGVLVPELMQPVVLRAVDASGAPAAQLEIGVKLKRGKLDGMPDSLVTDEAGLAIATVRPRYHDLLLELSPAGAAPQELRVLAKPIQLVTSVSQLMPGFGLRVEAEVESLHQRGEVHADLWRDGRWVAAASRRLVGGKARLAFGQPPSGREPLLFQTYRNFVAPGRSRHVLALQPADDPVAGLEELARRLEARGVERRWLATLRSRGLFTRPPNLERLAIYLLGRWPARPPAPPLLSDSGPRRVSDVAAHQSRTRRRIIVSLAIAGILLVLVVVSLILRNVLHVERHQRQTLMDALLEGELDEDEEGVLEPGRGGRGWWEACLLVGTIVMAIVGLLVMLDGLRWGLKL